MMYKNNSWHSRKINGFTPHQQTFSLNDNCYRISYRSYFKHLDYIDGSLK